MKVIYLAHPIRDSRGFWFHQQNIRRAERIALELWLMGFAVICPGKNTEFMDGAAKDDVWLKGDLEILKRCDLVVMAPGWQQSVGAKAERLQAVAHEKPVYFWPADADRLKELHGKAHV